MIDAMASWTDKLPGIGPREPLVAVLRLDGVIGAMGGFRRGLSLAALAPPLSAPSRCGTFPQSRWRSIRRAARRSSQR
ncbi:MAG: hypothetical protein VW405_14290 [Rhodospirillaceae bacterium]